jgi:hypothetical protein
VLLRSPGNKERAGNLQQCNTCSCCVYETLIAVTYGDVGVDISSPAFRRGWLPHFFFFFYLPSRFVLTNLYIILHTVSTQQYVSIMIRYLQLGHITATCFDHKRSSSGQLRTLLTYNKVALSGISFRLQ